MLRPAWFWVSIKSRKVDEHINFIYTESFQITSWGWVMINRQRFVCFSGNSFKKVNRKEALDAAIASINRVLMCKNFCSVERKWEARVWILFVWMGLCFYPEGIAVPFHFFIYIYIYIYTPHTHTLQLLLLLLFSPLHISLPILPQSRISLQSLWSSLLTLQLTLPLQFGPL
jgi:hypothetical protein